MTEEEMIQAAFDNLLQYYLKSNHRKKADVIQKAYNFALHATQNVRRPSGEHYMLHSLARNGIGQYFDLRGIVT